MIVFDGRSRIGIIKVQWLVAGGMRGYYFQEGGREVVVIRGDSSYVFKLDAKDRIEDVYLRLACDLNVLKPMTLQILDSMVGENLNGRLGELFVIFNV